MKTEITWGLDKNGRLSGARTRSLGPLEDHRKTFDLRWEFLRRNGSYQKYFKLYFKNKLLGVGQTKEIDFQLKYGISPPINPSCSCADVWKIIKKTGYEDLAKWGGMAWGAASLLMSNMDLHDGVYKTSLVGVWGSYLAGSDFALKTFTKYPKLYKKNIRKYAISEEDQARRDISIEINLNAPEPLIRKKVKMIVKEWQKLLNIKAASPRGKSAKRPFVKYIKVFDLRTKEKLTWSQIAREVGLPSSDNAKKKYKLAKQLVEGGYREIR